MPRTSLFAVILAVAVATSAVTAQEAFTYREYTFGASVAAIVAQTTSQAMSVKTLHERPSRIQQLEWFAGYTPEAPGRDPVRSIVFRFVDDQLFEMVVTYDTRRTEGLTTADVVAALADTYGPVPATDARASREPRPDGIGVDMAIAARWRAAAGSLALYRSLYATEYQLLVRSTRLADQAAAAAGRAEALDRLDAPRQEREQRLREADAAKASAEKARAANKAAFRP